MGFGVLGLIAAPAVELEGWFGESLVGSDPMTILSLVGMAMFMFVGCEFVTPLAPDLRKSASTMPKAMLLGLVGVASCMFIYGAAMKRQVENLVLDPATGVHLLDTPMAIPKFAAQVMGDIGPVWLGIGFLFAGAATINTLMAGVPRILYGMAVDGALPKVFTYLHPRFKTPLLCILVAMLIPCLHAWYLGGNVDNILHLVLAANPQDHHRQRDQQVSGAPGTHGRQDQMQDIVHVTAQVPGMQARNQHRHEDTQQRRLEAWMQIGEHLRQRPIHRHAIQDARR